MLNKIVALIASFLLSIAAWLGVNVALAPATQGVGSPGCVSDPEFNAANPGDRQVAVENDFETEGWLVSTDLEPGWHYTVKRYVRCASAPGPKNRVNVRWARQNIGGEDYGYTRLVSKWLSLQ